MKEQYADAVIINIRYRSERTGIRDCDFYGCSQGGIGLAAFDIADMSWIGRRQAEPEKRPCPFVISSKSYAG